jgi:uncharacterized delta-60 repeat protein
VTFGVFAEAPFGRPGSDNPLGSVSELTQSQSFRRTQAEASMKFTVSSVILATTDFQSAKQQLNRPDPNFLVTSDVYFEFRAYKTSTNDLFRKAGRASVSGNGEFWTPRAFSDGNGAGELWTMENFDFSVTPIIENFGGSITGCKGFGAVLKLKEPLTYSVDLSGIDIDEEFTIEIVTHAKAVNRRGGGSIFDCQLASANAFLRDPLEIGGTAIETTGLEPTNRPLPPPPPQALVSPASCVPGPGPVAAAGVLQFDAISYDVGEYAGMLPTITVSRTGGSSGAVSARLTTSDGSAIAGRDYTAVDTTVFFGDGESAPRVIEVPTLQNLVVGSDKTVILTLSQPGGCAALGVAPTALLFIRDDGGAGLPPPPSFTIGGTVSGLVGTGLVLQDLTFLPITPGNGPFTFALPTRSGSPYAVSVVTQPTNPLQICSVINGSGTVGNANITNVVVACADPPPNGALDANFASGGKATTPSTGTGNAVALQADGRIVTVGGAFTLTRHNPDGSIDTGFGTNGKVSTAFGSGSGSANDVVIQGDGKIVVAGSTRARAGFAGDDNFAVRRYNTDGSLDASFGAGGIVSTDFAGLGDAAVAVALQVDGKIVVAGRAQLASGTDLAVARYNTDGSPDASFGSGGKLTTDMAGGVDFSSAMRLQPDGRIVVLAHISLGSSVVVGIPALVRYNSDGSVDAAFGASGKVIGSASGPADDLALQPDGKIIVAGSVNAGSSTSAFGLTRFDANGSPDTAFGTPTTRFFDTGNGTIGRAVAVQADGKIVLVGEAASGASSTSDVAVARYDANGNLDTGFATGGKLLVDFFAGFDGAQDVVIQPDGRIVVAGSARNGSATDFALVRVNR